MQCRVLAIHYCRLKELLAEALLVRDGGKQRILTDSPADLALRLMETILHGEEVRSRSRRKSWESGVASAFNQLTHYDLGKW